MNAHRESPNGDHPAGRPRRRRNAHRLAPIALLASSPIPLLPTGRAGVSTPNAYRLTPSSVAGDAPGMDRRAWFDALGHDFYVDGRLVLHLSTHAKVQIAVLSVLESARWPAFVPSVLNGLPEQPTTKSLKHAIKALNRRQTWIAFHEDGDGVRWNWRTQKVNGRRSQRDRKQQRNKKQKPKPR